MALVDFFLRVSGKALRAFPKLARISPQAHCTSLVLDVLLREHEVDDGMLCLVIEFCRMGVCHAADVTRKLDDGALHAEAQSEERNRVLTRVLHGANLALDAAVAEAARHKYSLAPSKHLAELDVRRLNRLRIDPGDLDVRIIRDARMVQRLRHRHVGVGQIHILADDGDLNLLRGMLDLEDHLLPLFHVRRAVIHVELFEHNLVEAFLRHHQRNLVNCRRREVFDDGALIHITEKSELFLHIARNLFFRAANKDVGLDADAAKFFDAVLRRLRLQFARRRNVRHERHMDVEHIVATDLFLDLADRFEKRQALDIAYRAADFCDDDIGAVSGRNIIDALLDLIRDVRDDLHRLAQIIAAPFLRQHVVIDLARRDIGVFREVDIDETLIVSEIEIRLRTIVRDEHLAVLVWTHRAGVDVDIWIELLDRDLDAAILQEPPQGSSRDALAEGRNDAARNENILCHFFLLPCFRHILRKRPTSPAVSAKSAKLHPQKPYSSCMPSKSFSRRRDVLGLEEAPVREACVRFTSGGFHSVSPHFPSPS